MPPFDRLANADKAAIREALNAMAYGPFIQDWELPIRCHVDRAGYQAILRRWPALDDTRPPPDVSPSSSVYYAINGALAECCYAHEMNAAPWEDWLTVTQQQLIDVYKRWQRLLDENESDE
jgi:hypothetical protein